MAPDRGVEVEFAARVYATVPLPVPVRPELTVIQFALDAAVHEQVLPWGKLTPKLPVPPFAGAFAGGAGLKVAVHPAAACPPD